MTPDEILKTERTADQGVMAVMNESGDLKTCWDRTKPEEIDAARAQFDSLKQKGYMAYKVNAKGYRGEVISAFDPEAQNIILAPPMQGGN